MIFELGKGWHSQHHEPQESTVVTHDDDTVPAAVRQMVAEVEALFDTRKVTLR